MAFHSLSIGTSALLTARYGLDVTGQNLGNVDTPGYSRQRLNQAATKGWTGGLNTAVVGNGVWTTSITRVGNEYVEKQLRQATTTDEYYTATKNCYTNIQSFFAELSGNALSDSMKSFWGAMTNLNASVENLGVRTTTLNEAKRMTGHFNKLGESLDEYRRDVDGEIRESVSQINRILKGIAELNQQIVNTELGGESSICANDLRDQRGELVKELYSYMDVDVVEESNGSFIVSFHGRNMVYYDIVKGLTTEKLASDDGALTHQVVFDSDHYPCRPWDGKLAAQIEMRDEIIPGYKKDIDKLAANFIWEFNRAYSQTRGLESFNTLSSKNHPTNPAATLNELKYKDRIIDGTFEIKNGDLEIIIHNRVTNEPITATVHIDLDGRPGPDGEPDMILWDPDNPDASHSLINRLQKALDDKVPGAFKVEIDRNNQVTITSLKTDEYGFCFDKDESGVLAALGMNTFFTGHNANSMSVNEDLFTNPAHVGGAKSFEKGDNTGILDLLGVRDKELGNLMGMTLEGHYQSTAGRLGSEANRTSNMKNLSSDILTRMFNQREELAGVSEDEEVSKMITYQRAFQSAAKFISTMDQLYETLINM